MARRGELSPKSRGDWGEAQVAAYLRAHGYSIVASQYRCRFGEIDLIARDGDTLCFVEVKTRRNGDFGLPREYVTAAKQRKLRATAEYYLVTHDAADAPCRFDVAEVYASEEGSPDKARIIYLENAF